mmetsp:Transcript_54676/g.108788  ORF Transcript_54676/g.108788 Transcript_54676/m.108788 type:complete len:217 (-) Transcript_54676:465-1115(-)
MRRPRCARHLLGGCHCQLSWPMSLVLSNTAAMNTMRVMECTKLTVTRSQKDMPRLRTVTMRHTVIAMTMATNMLIRTQSRGTAMRLMATHIPAVIQLALIRAMRPMVTLILAAILLARTRPTTTRIAMPPQPLHRTALASGLSYTPQDGRLAVIVWPICLPSGLCQTKRTLVSFWLKHPHLQKVPHHSPTCFARRAFAGWTRTHHTVCTGATRARA